MWHVIQRPSQQGPGILKKPWDTFCQGNARLLKRRSLFHSGDQQSSDLQICVILTTVTMHYTQISLLLLLTHLLAFTGAGLNDIGGMFPPRDLIGDIGAKAVESLLPQANA